MNFLDFKSERQFKTVFGGSSVASDMALFDGKILPLFPKWSDNSHKINFSGIDKIFLLIRLICFPYWKMSKYLLDSFSWSIFCVDDDAKRFPFHSEKP